MDIAQMATATGTQPVMIDEIYGELSWSLAKPEVC